ncbi:hypothetical protein TRFO_30062 [Tritrichomonas foetus]|uniref:VPS9 domain-containing protein n=1 Tax=Tritrichomonas foetus TaxID=1144522 RepID=A0A1J4JZ29_9EUKA|nr:hypothetical protein TRFO_30062 [Tritrichomonas foetus]|eukprot:OHT02750.1 hypothetical protein TRFO_30062 [Tritrichomonas foetus]
MIKSNLEAIKTKKIEAWMLDHTDIAPCLVIDTQESYCNSLKKTIKQFNSERKKTHDQEMQRLKKFIRDLNKNVKIVEKELSILTEIPIADVPYLCYSDINFSLFQRKLTFVRLRVQKNQIQIATKKYGFFNDKLKDAHEFLRLFSDSDSLPCDQIYHLNDFYDYDFHLQAAISKHENNLKYLIPLEKRMAHVAKKLPRAKWAIDFKLFLNDAIKSGMKRINPDMFYFTPDENELEVSKCFFCHKSPIRPIVDCVLKNINTYTHSKDFVKQLLIKSFQLMPDRDKMTQDEMSICLLIFFRTLFNRCYELYSSLFKPKLPSGLQKLEDMGKMNANSFDIPLEMVGLEKPPENESIQLVFSRNKYFLKASQYFIYSMFMANPIDALFYVHEGILAINKAALINRGILSDDEETIEKKDIYQSEAQNEGNEAQNEGNEASNEGNEASNEGNEASNEGNETTNGKNCENKKENKSKGADSKNEINIQNSFLSLESLNKKQILTKDELENQAKQLICFDDMFVLLLGTIVCDEKPDIFYLSWFISTFSPKQCLSPPFEYAAANLEALSDHCMRFEAPSEQKDI